MLLSKFESTIFHLQGRMNHEWFIIVKYYARIVGKHIVLIISALLLASLCCYYSKHLAYYLATINVSVLTYCESQKQQL